MATWFQTETPTSNTLQLPGFQPRQLIGSLQHLLPSIAERLVEILKENFTAESLIESPTCHL